ESNDTRPGDPGGETRGCGGGLKLGPGTKAVSSPQSNGMAERFVKTMKEDYIAFMPKPDVRTALRNLAVAFTHYNENHPHSALGYHSPREYRRQRTSLT
ncbi:integrase core domain-containing protein, partial [Enterobacter cloacae]|uniref:integrase core domain-containing protein n=1 Tax=Enterobacter cloacae TaxID=550 RepID=UPI00201B4C15